MDSPSLLLLPNSWRISGFKNRPLPSPPLPRFCLERRGYYHCQLPAYCTVVVSRFSESSPGPYPRKARGHLEVEYKRLLTRVTAHGKALLLCEWCCSIFHISSLCCANIQGFLVLPFEFQVKWNNSNVTLRSQYKYIF